MIDIDFGPDVKARGPTVSNNIQPFDWKYPYILKFMVFILKDWLHTNKTCCSFRICFLKQGVILDLDRNPNYLHRMNAFSMLMHKKLSIFFKQGALMDQMLFQLCGFYILVKGANFYRMVA